MADHWGKDDMSTKKWEIVQGEGWDDKKSAKSLGKEGGGVAAGLGTAFFSILNALFFCVILKNALPFAFFYFLATYETPKERCNLLRSFLKNKKER